MPYLDHAATTRPSPAALFAFERAARETWGNPSSLHAPGRAAHDALESARGQVASALGCPPGRLFFTSGGTEANNLALRGLAAAGRARGKHIVTTALEHASVLAPLRQLQNEGYTLTVVPPGPDGRVAVGDILAAVRADTGLVSCVAVSGETGAAQDIAALGAALTRQGVLLHTDAVQAFLKTPFAAASADACTVSAHKLHGLPGAGGLYLREGLTIAPLLRGGGQEHNLRAGTQATAVWCAFGAAAEEGAARRVSDAAHMAALRDLLVTGLTETPGAVVLPPHDAPHIVAFSLPGYPSEVLLRFLSDRGVYVSAGSACSRGRRSAALLAMGLPAKVCDSALRASFGRDNTAEDVRALLDGLSAARENLTPSAR